MELPEHLVVLAPHPDDEVFGCGQLMANMREAGKKVSIVYLTCGEGSHRNCCETEEKEIAQARTNLAEKACEISNCDGEQIWAGIIDGDINSERDEKRIEEIVREIHNRDKVDAIAAPHRFEGWKDHENTYLIGKNVAQTMRLPFYEYCVWFWFSMPYSKMLKCKWKDVKFVRGFADTKEEAAKVYLTEKGPCGKPWSGVLPKIFVDANLGKRELFFGNQI